MGWSSSKALTGAQERKEKWVSWVGDPRSKDGVASGKGAVMIQSFLQGTQSAADQLEAEGVEEIPVAETQTEEAEASAEASEIDL